MVRGNVKMVSNKALLAKRLQENTLKHQEAQKEHVKELKELKRNIPIVDIQASPHQPRQFFAANELQELADSIAEIGLLQPISVRRVEKGYEIIAGERRLRAHQLLNKANIEAIVVDVNDEDAALLTLAENLKRQDLTDYEIAKSVIAFKNGFPNKSEYANTLGISRQDLYRLLSFEKLPLEIQQRLDNSPTLLTAKTAEQIGQFIKNNDIASEKMVEILNEVLDLVLTEGLKQNGILNEIEIRVKGNKGNNIKNGNRTVKIFAIDGKKVGQIKKNLNKTTIEFSNDILDQHQQAIEKFFETLISS